MKIKALAILTSLAMASGVFGQGVLLQNLANSGGQGATSGGLVYVNNGTTTSLFDGLQYNLGVTVLGGSSAGSLVSMGTFTAATDPKGYTGFDLGKFQLGNAAFTVPGVSAGGVAVIQLKFWFDGVGGLFANYAAAAAGGGYVGTVTFNNPTSNPGGTPPTPDQQLTGMPSVILAAAPVPEPTTLALAGMGAAAMLIFRRRK